MWDGFRTVTGWGGPDLLVLIYFLDVLGTLQTNRPCLFLIGRKAIQSHAGAVLSAHNNASSHLVSGTKKELNLLNACFASISPVFSVNSWASSPQAVGDRHRPADQQPNAQPALPPAAGPPPPRPRHVRLLPPVRHLRLHTRLAGCLTSAADQVTRGGGAPSSH